MKVGGVQEVISEMWLDFYENIGDRALRFKLSTIVCNRAEWTLFKLFRALTLEEERFELLCNVAPGNCDPEPSPELVFDRQELTQIVNEALSQLDSKKAEIIRGRYGFYGVKETLEQVGRRVSLSKERARQVQSRAERSLKFNPVFEQKAWPHLVVDRNRFDGIRFLRVNTKRRTYDQSVMSCVFCGSRFSIGEKVKKIVALSPSLWYGIFAVNCDDIEFVDRVYRISLYACKGHRFNKSFYTTVGWQS